MKFKICSWNVNSLLVRLDHIKELIIKHSPDVIMLQETKVIDEKFPRDFFDEFGYNYAFHGQKSYNGVAILSKFRLEEIATGKKLFNEENARYIESSFTANGRFFKVASVYVPNGGEISSEKFTYKMDFLNRLTNYLATITQEENFIIGGDFNIAASNLDVYDPMEMEGQILFSPEERRKLYLILNLPLFDSFRIDNPEKIAFSWWDYRDNSFKKNLGVRIDYLLSGAKVLDSLGKTEYLTEFRAMEKPSDHVPVITEVRI